MLPVQPEKQNQPNNVIDQFIETSSRKIKAIGAGMAVFLKAVEKIAFSKEPVHVPDQKLIDEAVRILTGEQTQKQD